MAWCLRDEQQTGDVIVFLQIRGGLGRRITVSYRGLKYLLAKVLVLGLPGLGQVQGGGNTSPQGAGWSRAGWSRAATPPSPTGMMKSQAAVVWHGQTGSQIHQGSAKMDADHIAAPRCYGVRAEAPLGAIKYLSAMRRRALGPILTALSKQCEPGSKTTEVGLLLPLRLFSNLVSSCDTNVPKASSRAEHQDNAILRD
ncbi:hypothetical protein EYF80_002403 [Liparis tanakae]|uniref:Uncharacterized protein n=1 Tax=Liparis tanakae TaxID=230148 RepID=A0A4Z2JB41_9TELE|nr:hypothetical protein EYF80_002403 [Liparis tanakae]